MGTGDLDSQQPKLVTTVFALDKARLPDHEAFTLDQISEIMTGGALTESTVDKYETHIYSDNIRFELAKNGAKLPDIHFKNIVQFVTLTDYPGVCFILSKKRSQGQYIIIRFENSKQLSVFRKLIQRSNNQVLFDVAEPQTNGSETDVVKTHPENIRDGRQSHSPPAQTRKPIVLQKPTIKRSTRPTNLNSEVACKTTFVSTGHCDEHQAPGRGICTQTDGLVRNSRSQDVHVPPSILVCLRHSSSPKADGMTEGPNGCRISKATAVAAVQTDRLCQCSHQHNSFYRASEKIQAIREPQTTGVIPPHISKATQTKANCACKHSGKAHTRHTHCSHRPNHSCKCRKSQRSISRVKLPVAIQCGEHSSFSTSSDSSSELSYKIYCAHSDRNRVSRTLRQEDKLPQLYRPCAVKPSKKRPRRFAED
ncbi:hypothetical protein AAHC03_01631 [Spirometra sp. Aus1]